VEDRGRKAEGDRAEKGGGQQKLREAEGDGADRDKKAEQGVRLRVSATYN